MILFKVTVALQGDISLEKIIFTISVLIAFVGGKLVDLFAV